MEHSTGRERAHFTPDCSSLSVTVTSPHALSEKRVAYSDLVMTLGLVVTRGRPFAGCGETELFVEVESPDRTGSWINEVYFARQSEIVMELSVGHQELSVTEN